jgi:phospholipid/cholesterol/gamma-HCH transport system substrate-binding protein
MALSKEAKTGIIVTAALIVFYVGFNFLRGIEVFSNKAHYYALYDNIDGLTESNPVIINGLNIGRISNIKLDQVRNKIIVELQVPDDLVLTQKCTALLINSDFLGSKAITLQLAKEGAVLQHEDTLQSAVDPSITEFLMENAQPLASSLNTAIRSINEALGEFNASSATISEILESAKVSTQHVQSMMEENRNDLRKISSNLAVLSENLVAISEDVPQTIAKIDAVADSLRQIEINTTLLLVNQTLQEIQSFSSKLNEQEGSLNALMTERALYDNLNRSAASLDSLLSDLKENPDRYVHFSLFGRRKP